MPWAARRGNGPKQATVYFRTTPIERKRPRKPVERRSDRTNGLPRDRPRVTEAITTALSSLRCSTALVCGLPFALGLLGYGRLGMHLSLGLLRIRRAARLGAFGLLRSGRLALHLALGILR